MSSGELWVPRSELNLSYPLPPFSTVVSSTICGSTFLFLFILLIAVQEFVEARRTAGLNNAPLCSWSSTPPLELKEVPAEALSANAGFVSFGKLRKDLFVEFLHDCCFKSKNF